MRNQQKQLSVCPSLSSREISKGKLPPAIAGTSMICPSTNYIPMGKCLERVCPPETAHTPISKIVTYSADKACLQLL